MFKLKKPCEKCPFRNNIPGYLTRARVIGLASALEQDGERFLCHSTLDYNAADDLYLEDTDEAHDAWAEAIVTADSQHCAGAAIVLARQGTPNRDMLMAERFGVWNRSELDLENKDVFQSMKEFIEHHSNRS
jgi:hypothetical protein